MKNVIIIFLLFTLCGQTYAQSILDFFYSIPAEYLDNLSYVERKQLIETNRSPKMISNIWDSRLSCPEREKISESPSTRLTKRILIGSTASILNTEARPIGLIRQKNCFTPSFNP